MPLTSQFEAALGQLLPRQLPPRLALAVSGGADSTALALLARDYCLARGGQVLALIVDHGLRSDSAQEACQTQEVLKTLQVPSQILKLDLEAGSAMQARARAARYQALAQAALAAGFVYLAIGHHQGDQYETVAMRLQRGDRGGEGMAAWIVRDGVVLLRPLLGISPALLRTFLREQGVEWAEDPSNQLRRFERVRIRQDQTGQPPQKRDERIARDLSVADFLARHGTFYPEGHAVLEAEALPVAALGVLIRTVGGGLYSPRQEALQRLAQSLRPATLGGVRIARAGRLGNGWLFVREPAACALPIPAVKDAIWDGRFKLLRQAEEEMTLGALGAQASLFKGYKRLPALVLQGMAALRSAKGDLVFPAPVCFLPPLPLAPRSFVS